MLLLKKVVEKYFNCVYFSNECMRYNLVAFSDLQNGTLSYINAFSHGSSLSMFPDNDAQLLDGRKVEIWTNLGPIQLCNTQCYKLSN